MSLSATALPKEGAPAEQTQPHLASLPQPRPPPLTRAAPRSRGRGCGLGTPPAPQAETQRARWGAATRPHGGSRSAAQEPGPLHQEQACRTHRGSATRAVGRRALARRHAPLGQGPPAPHACRPAARIEDCSPSEASPPLPAHGDGGEGGGGNTIESARLEEKACETHLDAGGAAASSPEYLSCTLHSGLRGASCQGRESESHERRRCRLAQKRQ